MYILKELTTLETCYASHTVSFSLLGKQSLRYRATPPKVHRERKSVDIFWQFSAQM